MSDSSRSTREVETPKTQERLDLSRRGFLTGLGGAAAVAGFGTVGGGELLAPTAEAEAALLGPYNGSQRRQTAFQIRQSLAVGEKQAPIAPHPCNGDESLYGDRRGSFSKALPHDNLGEVDPNAYLALLAALDSGDSDDFAQVPTGGPGRLANPQAAYAFSLSGADSHRLGMPAAPAFASAWNASEIAEVYWHAVTRDVPFTDWAGNADTNAAAADLSAMSDFRGPKQGGQVTIDTLFRGGFGDLGGPYLSQFLWQPIPFGPKVLDQTYPAVAAGDDYMTDYSDWLAVQRGILPSPAVNTLGFDRYISNARDLGQFVHTDFSYQAYLQAALICLGFGPGARDQANPYQGGLNTNQGGFITFGGAEVLDLVARAGNQALKAAWFQKWLVHRRLRPEAMGGRIHNQVTGAKNYGVHPDILNSPVLSRVFSDHGTYLLPMAYPEGSPTHPAYPAGHAVIAGACVTVLKAFFDDQFVLPNPVEADSTGTVLNPWGGGDLLLGDELDKLGVNISIGRDLAGVHWRTDGTEGMLLGEQVAIELLRDYRNIYTETGFAGYTLRKFDGSVITL
jgi:hypothetical protein